MRHLALLLAAVGCSPTLYVYTETPAEHRTVIRDAGREMSVRIKLVDEPGRGAVELDFNGHDAGVCGAALEKVVGYPEHPNEAAEALIAVAKDPTSEKALAAAREFVDCTPVAWSCGEPRYIAHELGHVLGLRHKAGTAMDPAPSVGYEFTEAQQVTTALVAVGFTLFCGEPGGNVSDPLEPNE